MRADSEPPRRARIAEGDRSSAEASRLSIRIAVVMKPAETSEDRRRRPQLNPALQVSPRPPVTRGAGTVLEHSK